MVSQNQFKINYWSQLTYEACLNLKYAKLKAKLKKVIIWLMKLIKQQLCNIISITYFNCYQQFFSIRQKQAENLIKALSFHSYYLTKDRSAENNFLYWMWSKTMKNPLRKAWIPLLLQRPIERVGYFFISSALNIITSFSPLLNLCNWILLSKLC